MLEQTVKVATAKRPRRKVEVAGHAVGCCCWGCVTALEEWVRETIFVQAAAGLAERDRMVRMAQFPLTQQIEELETELSSRRVNYPRQVGSGKLRQSEAEYRIARLESAIKTLKWLKDNEEAVRSVAKRETNGTE